jgi:mono/diheme cytochrome c family protein
MRSSWFAFHQGRMSCLLALTVAGVFACACDRAPGGEGQWPISKAELHEQPSEPGESTYRRYCIGCHGADGRGNGGVTGADLTAQGGPLVTKSDAELLSSVRDGKRGERATMPAHSPVLTSAQLEEVLGFVKERYAPTPAKP